MRRTDVVVSPKKRLGQALLAVLLGVTAGLFVSGYWLIDLFPADSRLLILLTVIAAAAAAAGYYLGIGRASTALRGLGRRDALGLVAVSGLLGCFLFFAGTARWQVPERYIGFLLPEETFLLTGTSSPPGTRIVWINTSLGDVSLDSLSAEGWTRHGDQMALGDPGKNWMAWQGLVGEHLEIVFESPEGGGEFTIRWGEDAEIIRLASGKSTYERTFPVPFFASRQAVIGLGLLHFWLLTALALLLIRHEKGSVGRRELAQGDSERRMRAIRHELPALAAIMGLALLLRGFNLGAVFPAVDEYYHLIAASQLLDGVPSGAVYPRGLWIVTFPVALALRILGHEVWAARAVGVLFNVLALLPLYFLSRRINRPAAITVCLLYAVSPWIITFARVAREYAYYPLYFYLIIWAMISLVEGIPRGFVVQEQWRRLLQPKIIFLVVVLLIPPIFALRIDWLSTFRTILIAYVVLGLFILARFDWRARGNWPVLIVGVVFVGGLCWYFYQEQFTKLLFIPRVNPVPLGYFFANPPQQWYYDRVSVIAAIAVAAGVVSAFSVRRTTIVGLFFVGLFGAYLLVFTLFSKSFFHTRHLISTQFWYVVLAGIGLCCLWGWLRSVLPWKGGTADAVLALGLLVLTVNPSQVLLPTLSRDPDMVISEDYLHDMSEVQAYMTANVRPGETLVSTVYGLYATWEGKPEFVEQFRMNSGTTRDEIESIVREHAAGWLVIDAIRLDMSELTKRSLSSIPQMEYIGTFGDEYVWRWGRPPAE